MRFAAVASIALWLVATVSPQPTAAFYCSIPGVFNEAKKTVCADPTLAALATTELDALANVRDRLAADARAAVTRDRRTFIAARDACRVDSRCLEATYLAQLRLYRGLVACEANAGRQMFCVNRTILKHRETQHRSM